MASSHNKLVLNIIVFSILIYFIFHSIYGNRGIIAYFKLQSETNKYKEELANLRQKRLEIENETKLLRPGSIDKDLLDEKIRSMLGYARNKEKIFSSKIDK